MYLLCKLRALYFVLKLTLLTVYSIFKKAVSIKSFFVIAFVKFHMFCSAIRILCVRVMIFPIETEAE